MRRPLLALVLLALACAGAALASGGEPKKAITAADQARARAMLLRRADLRGNFHVERNGLGSGTSSSCRALDESDLTLTGDARSPGFAWGFVFAASQAQVYASVPQARTSWRRSVSAAGLGCLRAELRKEFTSNGLTLVSLHRTPFPRVSEQTVAYRLVLSGPTQAGGKVSFFFDIIGLMRSRAQTSLFIGSALRAEPRPEELRLARVLAARMATAMRGA